MSVQSRNGTPGADIPAPPGRSGAPGEGGVGATLGIVALSMALLWAGTHQLGALYAERPYFSSVRWVGSLALLAAAGFVFANVIRPVDVRAKIDWRRIAAVVSLPTLVLLVCWTSLEFQYTNSLVDTLFTWASPFGHGILATLVGVGVTTGMRSKS